jgi:hypothetical protein
MNMLVYHAEMLYGNAGTAAVVRLLMDYVHLLLLCVTHAASLCSCSSSAAVNDAGALTCAAAAAAAVCLTRCSAPSAAPQRRSLSS